MLVHKSQILPEIKMIYRNFFISYLLTFPYFPKLELSNIACQTLLFSSLSLVRESNVMEDLELKQSRLASNVGQFRQILQKVIKKPQKPFSSYSKLDRSIRFPSHSIFSLQIKDNSVN